MGHAVEPLVDGAGDVALARDTDLGEGLQAPLKLGKLGDLGLGPAPPPAHMHNERNGESDERKDGEACERKQNEDGVERDAPHSYGVESHGENL
jgi:hypothetical protein